jgi:hypothetical protein
MHRAESLWVEHNAPGESVQFHRLAESLERSTLRGPLGMLCGLWASSCVGVIASLRASRSCEPSCVVNWERTKASTICISAETSDERVVVCATPLLDRSIAAVGLPHPCTRLVLDSRV